MRLDDFTRVRVFTHAQSTTPYGFKVGHIDDFLAGIFARHLGSVSYTHLTLPTTERV